MTRKNWPRSRGLDQSDYSHSTIFQFLFSAFARPVSFVFFINFSRHESKHIHLGVSFRDTSVFDNDFGGASDFGVKKKDEDTNEFLVFSASW
jgi:hypothetical protein